MKLLRNIIFGLLIIACIVVIVVCVSYNNMLKPMDKNDKSIIQIEIPSGSSSKTIGNILENNGLIKNADFFVLYLKIYKIDDLKASVYELDKSMDLPTIVDIISKGNSYNPNQISITFQEGLNMRKYASIIESKTNNTYDDVMNKLKDVNYINSLIDSYWFLTDKITNKDIYYPLEGYLFPNTYIFSSKNVTVEEIFKKLLDQTNIVLSKYKDKIESSKMSVHEILTMASMVELEATNKADYRQNVASVFFNRLSINMSLGSDVTTCYAQKFDDTALCHRQANFNLPSPYNTRPLDFKGLPVGPIANPSESSINAVLNPADTEYVYFVADKHTNVYFFKTYNEFNAKIAELKNKGDWL